IGLQFTRGVEADMFRSQGEASRHANGTIQAVQYQGAATRFELKLNGGEKLLVSQANMTGEELPATLTPGQQVMVSWSRDVMVPLVEER
ncbi:TOBE domain-containing protein, partial [Escherichia sp. TWPC-MK]